jgi:hypothetical protein
MGGAQIGVLPTINSTETAGVIRRPSFGPKIMMRFLLVVAEPPFSADQE